SIVDNILLAIPLQVLTEEEKKSKELPAGQNWAVLTEEDYQCLKEEKQKENNPFASLQGLFDE
ncbi:TPA: YceD family protein, partial [Streptococcus pyogenes]